MPLFQSSLDARRTHRTSPPLWSGFVLIGAAVSASIIVVLLTLALLTSLL